MAKKVLYVEDEPTLRKTVADVLKQEGFEVVLANDGVEGLNAAREQEPDLILLDLILPKKDGFEVLKELKSDEKTKDIPVIVVTNLEGPGDVERALELGATTYLVKSNYSLEELIKKIKETFE